MNKVLVIIGPTAVGKTKFGIECAKLFDGEIISGDSIQIYKGLDIGSAKATIDERREAIHHLIDIKEPNENYSVKEFQDLGREYINIISSKNKLPIIVGGTGLYIKACLYDYVFFNEEDKDDEFNEMTNQEIYDELMKIDPSILDKIHINNRKRLVRALNIYKKNNLSISKIKDEQDHKPIYDIKIIGLTLKREELYKRIEFRVEKMFEEGLVEEIKDLLEKGITFDNQAMQGIGYKEFRNYFEGEESLDDVKEKIIINTRHFVKRQFTFFNNQFEMNWYEDKNEAIKDIKEWLAII